MHALPDGWTIYVLLLVGAAIVISAMIMIRWAYKNEQFNEAIKYVVFDEHDKDKMTPEEYKKSQEVNKAQEPQRKEFLEKNYSTDLSLDDAKTLAVAVINLGSDYKDSSENIKMSEINSDTKLFKFINEEEIKKITDDALAKYQPQDK